MLFTHRVAGSLSMGAAATALGVGPGLWLGTGVCSGRGAGLCPGGDGGLGPGPGEGCGSGPGWLLADGVPVGVKPPAWHAVPWLTSLNTFAKS